MVTEWYERELVRRPEWNKVFSLSLPKFVHDCYPIGAFSYTAIIFIGFLGYLCLIDFSTYFPGRFIYGNCCFMFRWFLFSFDYQSIAWFSRFLLFFETNRTQERGGERRGQRTFLSKWLFSTSIWMCNLYQNLAPFSWECLRKWLQTRNTANTFRLTKIISKPFSLVVGVFTCSVRK